MDDENFRKAIAYGIDRNDLISSAMMGLGEATLTPLNDNFWAISQTAYVASVHDDRMARELLQQAADKGYRRASEQLQRMNKA